MGQMLQRFVAEHEALISLAIFGVLAMMADLCSDIGWTWVAAGLRIAGIVALIGLLIYVFYGRRRVRLFPVPLMFTTEGDREKARALFERFVSSQRLSVKPIERCTPVPAHDLLIVVRRDPREAQEPSAWEEAWQSLVREWEQEVDRRLMRSLMPNEQLRYHLCPHLWLPLAFALGAAVGLRRAIVLYHRQQDRFYRVLDLSNPRCLFEEPAASVPPPEREPPDWTALPAGERLALHIGITDRHAFPEFSAHPDQERIISAALVYRQALNPERDWLPYVQWLYRAAQPLLGNYPQVDVCLTVPVPIAFALGMACSRTPKIRVCDYRQAGQYVPVFSLATIEQRLPFD